MRKSDAYTSHIFVDSTASDDVPDHYARWLEAGCHVVTPNKKFGSGSLERYKRGQELCATQGAQFLYEVASRSKDVLIDCSRRQWVRGCLCFRHCVRFWTQATRSDRSKVSSAERCHTSLIKSQKTIHSPVLFRKQRIWALQNRIHEMTLPVVSMLPSILDIGWNAEGMDVARKVVVLARECGLDIELEDLDIESLVPKELQSIPDAVSFLKELPKVCLPISFECMRSVYSMTRRCWVRSWRQMPPTKCSAMSALSTSRSRNAMSP